MDTQTDTSSTSELSTSLSKECHLNFTEQCKLVYEGLKKGFTYDGCTSSPDFNFGYDCCGEHDYYYQSGEISRAEADKRLRKCMQKKGYIVLPWVYWAGVRLFGRGIWAKHKHEDQK